MSTALSTVPGIQAALGRHAKSLLLLWEPPSILLCGPSLQLTCRISGLLHLTPSIFGFLPQLDVITQLRKSSVSPHCPPRTSTLLSVLCNPVCAGHPTLLPDHVPAPSSTCMSPLWSSLLLTRSLKAPLCRHNLTSFSASPWGGSSLPIHGTSYTFVVLQCSPGSLSHSKPLGGTGTQTCIPRLCAPCSEEC